MNMFQVCVGDWETPSRPSLRVQ